LHKDDLKKKIGEILGTAEMHGYELQKHLTSRGLRQNLSYLYRVLAEMEREGYLESSRMKGTLGPKKRVYKLSKKGSDELDQELNEAVKTIHAKYMKYLAKLPPEKSAIIRLQRLLDKHVGRGNKILVVAPKVFYDWMASPLCDSFKGARIYLAKPQSVKVSMEFPNMTVLDTTIENILIKDNFIDAVRVHGEPENANTTLTEFHRILKKDGSLAYIIPYFHPQKNNSPMTLGEFVEKIEYEVSESDKTKLDFATTTSLLSRYFRTVKHSRISQSSLQ
jgi:DNA-binding PadR family transcriptional regulator